jgi:predicted transcriptional regulator
MSTSASELAEPARAAAYMTSPVHEVEPNVALPEVDRLLQSEGLSAVVVRRANGRPLGVISRSDLVARAVGPGHVSTSLSLPEDLTAEDAMTGELVTADVGDELSRVARVMAKKRIHRVFIERGGDLEGVVATRDIMRAIADARVTTTLGDAMTTSLIYVRTDEPMQVVAERITKAKVHGLLVMEEEWPVGLITMTEVLVAQHWPPDIAVEEWMSPRLLCLPTGMALHRAAAHALAMDVRHVVVMNDEGAAGLVTGVDFARAYARTASPSA